MFAKTLVEDWRLKSTILNHAKFFFVCYGHNIRFRPSLNIQVRYIFSSYTTEHYSRRLQLHKQQRKLKV